MGFFFFMLLIFLFAFAVFAEQMFGLNLEIFSDLLRSSTTLLTMMFGVVDIYWDIIASQTPGLAQIIGMVFFLGYTVWMFFILINVSRANRRHHRFPRRRPRGSRHCG